MLAGTALMALSLPATAADFFAANESELATAIASANASGDAVNTIAIRNVTLANGAAVGGAGGSSVDGGGGAFPGQDGQSATTDAGADGGGPIGGVGGS